MGPYVVVELQGRLGNQLFQFASGYAIARRHDARLLFSPWRVPEADRLLPRLIGERYREAEPLELLRVGAGPDGVPMAGLLRSVALRSARAVRRIRRTTPPSLVVWDDTGRFRPDVFARDLPLRIVGHLQSERYFADCADEIATAIRLPEPPAVGDGRRPLVGVSFRRGDYNTLGWALPVDYYDRAMTHVADLVGPVTIVCFGDDPAFVELMAPRLSAFGDVVDGVARDPDPVAQLALMARCDHQVIANSSFAWWGAWLGDQRGDRRGDADRIVIAPAEFAGGDRVPERWTTLETGVEPF